VTRAAVLDIVAIAPRSAMVSSDLNSLILSAA